MDITIPIAEAVGAEVLGAEEPSSLLESLNHSHRALCETIKLHRDNFSDFCEDDEERDNALKPIEQDPEPYSNGTIKTRPILKKYAKSLCEKLELEERMEATEESLRDTDLTPQQVKLDMKRYVAMSEKKIANQQEQIERLNDKLVQLSARRQLAPQPGAPAPAAEGCARAVPRATQKKQTGVKGCRDMAKCFTHKQRIRHTIGINKTWIGIYDSSKNIIEYDGKAFTLNKFARTHIKLERPHRRCTNVNAWKDCECEKDGKWISTVSLQTKATV